MMGLVFEILDWETSYSPAEFDDLVRMERHLDL
jgi:hypothetical protein